MKKLHFITLKSLDRACDKVQSELFKHGFWDDKLEKVDVHLVPVGTVHGWQGYGGSGHIYIPSVSAARLLDRLKKRYNALVDIIRHEYGHAVADTHRGLMRRKSFASAFWVPHIDETKVEFDPRLYVTRYATTNASEDFAETFMLYLKHGGRLPRRLDTPVIRKKWNWVGRLGGTISRGG